MKHDVFPCFIYGNDQKRKKKKIEFRVASALDFIFQIDV